MNYRYQPPAAPQPDDDDDSQFDEYEEVNTAEDYGYTRYGDESDSDRRDSGGTPTWLKVIIVLGVVLIVASLVLSTAGPAFFGGDPPTTQSNYDIVGFVSAIDYATIVVDLDGDEATVKLIAVESAGAGDLFDAQVADAIREALEGETLTLERAGTPEDADGNLLRYVYLSNRTMLNALLVRNGFARVSDDVAPDNGQYLARMRGAEELARVENLGVWGLTQ